MRCSGAPMPVTPICLLRLLAHQIEALERRLVGDQEQVGFTVERLVREEFH